MTENTTRKEFDTMAEPLQWQWDEAQQVGTDYTDVFEVERYERRMGTFRDLAVEDAAILDMLAVSEGSHILEIGTGTGHFARVAAQAGHRVMALDVSPVMLQYAEQRAKADGLSGIEWRRTGFLALTAPPATFDAAVSVVALHHLPDVWKAVALHNIRTAMKPGGNFLLGDVVFSDQRDPRPQMEAWIGNMPEAMHKEVANHIAKEYSTFDWIMEGLLTRAGFSIRSIDRTHAPLIQYLCVAELET